MSALRAVSFSRDSDGKEQRLREWRAKNGLLTDEDREAMYGPLKQARSIHDREHRTNRKVAFKHGIEIVAGLNSTESAGEEGERGHQILEVAKATDATIVLVPSLRRLGVGVAQIQLRKKLEAEGLQVISERETEAILLASAPSPTRDRLLAQIAHDDEYEWQVSKERLRKAHFDYWSTIEGEAVLDFVAERPHLSLRQLCVALEFHRHRTPRGNTHWHPPQAADVRRKTQNRNVQAEIISQGRKVQTGTTGATLHPALDSGVLGVVR